MKDATRTTGVRSMPVAARTHLNLRSLSLLVAAGSLATLPTANAFEPFGSPTEDETAAFDELWKAFTLHKDDSNPILQEFKLRGRYHGQYHWLDSDQGNADAWEDRRA